MNWSLAFWAFAFVVMTSLVVLVARAIRFARRRDLERHRRTIVIAGWVVAGFVASYAVKVALLGREDKTGWTDLDLVVLYVHEALVGTMLLTGLAGALIGRRLFRALAAKDPGTPPPAARRHHLLGRTCAISALLALATGAIVLYRMIVRLG